MQKKKILGIDPGTQKTGYAIVQIQANKRTLLSSGVITTNAKQALHVRYHTIFKQISALIKEFKPTALSIETQFVQKNVASAMKISMARAAALIAATDHCLQVFEYSPTAVKKAITSKGSATKEQIKKMIAALINLPYPIESDDEADAVAIALCHHFRDKRIVYV